MRKIDYLPQFKGFGIADADFDQLIKKELPVLMLEPKDFGIASGEKPAVIGVLLGRDEDNYCLSEDYVHALINAGARILFLDYRCHLLQLSFCDGLLLPGGSFATPEWYYSDAKNNYGDYPSDRANAYAECFWYAHKAGIPILGICAGMQVIAAESGLKLFRSSAYFDSELKHKTDEFPAHHIDVVANTAFSELMDNSQQIAVNSRHNEFVAPINVQRELLNLKENQKLPLEIYACATDGIPEAIGDMENGILGVQWHPENMAAQGNEIQQRIFDWLVIEALFVKAKNA